jgi:hypothetical protein
MSRYIAATELPIEESEASHFLFVYPGTVLLVSAWPELVDTG